MIANFPFGMVCREIRRQPLEWRMKHRTGIL